MKINEQKRRGTAEKKSCNGKQKKKLLGGLIQMANVKKNVTDHFRDTYKIHIINQAFDPSKVKFYRYESSLIC